MAIAEKQETVLNPPYKGKLVNLLVQGEERDKLLELATRLPAIQISQRSLHDLELIEKIKSFVETYNRKSKPFMWTATADSILAKTNRLCKYISGTAH